MPCVRHPESTPNHEHKLQPQEAMRRQRCPPHGRFGDECGSLLCGCIQGARDRMPDQSLDSVTAWTKQRLGGSTAALAARETHQSTQCRPPTNKPIPHLHDLKHIRRTRHNKKNPDRLQPRAALGLQRCFKEDCFGGGVGHPIVGQSKTPEPDATRTQFAAEITTTQS